MACSGNGNGRKRNFNPGVELKILVLKASSLLSTKSKKRSPLAITEGSGRGQHKIGKGKAQKFVQVITIFVNPSAMPCFSTLRPVFDGIMKDGRAGRAQG